LKNLTRYDPGTPEGAEFHTILDKDPRLQSAEFAREDLSNDRKRVEEILNGERFKTHWESYKGRKPRARRHWYSLCSPAIDLRTLAREVGRESEYVLLYDSLSEGSHASDVMTGIMHITPTKELVIHQLRGPVEKVKELTSLAGNFLVWSHNHVLATYLAAHEVQHWFTRWYGEDYRAFFLWATTPGPLFVKAG